MNPNLVILAAGVASRMRKSLEETSSLNEAVLKDAKEKSKGLIGVGEGNCPFLDYLLYNARESGYNDIVLVVGEQSEAFRSYYGGKDRDNNFHGLKISYAIQKIPDGRTKPLGTADAVLQALLARPDWSGQKFTVCNSDNLYSKKALKLLLKSLHLAALIDYDRSEMKFEQERVEAFAVLQKDTDGYLTDIVEKPSKEEVQKATDKHGRVGVSMNIFRFSYDIMLPILKEVPLHPVRLEKELPKAVMMQIEQYPKSVYTIPLSEHVPDLTSKTDIIQVQDYLRQEFPNFSIENK